MSSQLERTATELFPESGGHIGNVKFFAGSSRDVTAEALIGQLLSANAQIAAGAQPMHDIDGDM